LLGVAETPYRVEATAALDDESAIDELLADIDPPSNVEVSAAHRRRLAPVLARRALRDARDSA
jgi:CO/xanthine dehydrogenase FAD-binding subunit